MPLDSGLEAQSCIKQESIMYQEVYPNDFLIYSHPEVKEYVKNVHWILVDGIFKSCPVSFKQLLTILARDEQTGTFFSNPTCVDAIAYDGQLYAFTLISLQLAVFTIGKTTRENSKRHYCYGCTASWGVCSTGCAVGKKLAQSELA